MSGLAGLTNCFLIRDPAEVIVSYLKKNDDPTLEDLGFVQQAGIFEWVREAVGDGSAGDRCAGCLAESGAVAASSCVARLEWSLIRRCFLAAGLRETDGVWAKHWYGEVAKSTGFEPYRERRADVPERLREIEARYREGYERLYSTAWLICSGGRAERGECNPVSGGRRPPLQRGTTGSISPILISADNRE